MTAYHVNHAYTARRDGQQFGPWEAGADVEIDTADAEWIERDSPGCLSPAKKAEREQPPVKDRQHRGGANRGT